MKILVDVILKFLSNLIRRCPATMLADSRTDRVIGRIRFLTSSIRTMKFISMVGVPKGTICDIICFGNVNHPMIRVLIHMVMAVENEMDMCAVGVKMNGNNASRFVIMIKKNMSFMRVSLPFLLLVFSIVFTSFLIA